MKNSVFLHKNFKMKKIVLFFFSGVVSFGLLASKHNHFDENEVRYVKENMALDSQYQEFLRKSHLWKNFSVNNPNWFVIFNERNQLPHRAFGAPIAVSDLQSFLISQDFILPNDLRETLSIKNDKHINKTYVQYYNNLEVLGSKLYAKFSHNNELIAFGLDVFNDIDISTVPSLDSQSAISIATSNISNVISDVVVQNNLKVLANPKYREYEYHLIYEVSFSTSIEEGPANYICYVDAHSGDLLMRKNTVMYELPPTGVASVTGEVYPNNPNNPSIIESFKYLKAIDQTTNTNYYTDNNGDIVLPMNLGTSVRYKLEGLYADVQTSGSTPDIFQNLASTNNIVFDNSNSTIQERTAYQAVNNIHDHMKVVFPAFTALDNPIETNIDEFGSCNAFYDGNSINFYAEGSSNGIVCNATAKIPDVVFHEYGHAINSDRYNGSGWGGGMQNGGLNEGFADVWALSLTTSPVLGYGFYLNDPTGYVRRYDQNRKVYPQDLVGEVHADGEIIAGAFWDLYLNFGNMSQMLDLFKYTYDSGVDAPDGDEGALYTDILLEVLYADDNDGNLSNGTPNDLYIVDAFALHGITLLSNAEVSHNPVSTANVNTGIVIDASVTMTYPWALSNANCFYRLNDASIWTSLAMNGVSSFTTTIPAQAGGTIIAYYLSLVDNFGNESAVTPMAANLAPITNANLPYFTMVGYDIVDQEDFDFNIGFWQAGIAGDNATTGEWDYTSQLVGSLSSDGDTVQTFFQHTPGGFSCAVTGNSSNVSTPFTENDVDGGHTTLLSPEFDLSSYNDPAFSYWRWYTNNTGSEPNADWWQVLITDDGVNWEYVENNRTSDISWRKFAFRVKDYVNLTTKVQLKFIASDSTNGALSSGSLVEAAVDDLVLYESQANSTLVNEVLATKPKLMKITDLLGRVVDPNLVIKKTTLLYIYNDGSVERKVIAD